MILENFGEGDAGRGNVLLAEGLEQLFFEFANPRLFIQRDDASDGCFAACGNVRDGQLPLHRVG